MKIASLLSTASVAANAAETLIPAVDFFVKQAESASTSTPQSGAQKLSAVKVAVQALVSDGKADPTSSFEDVWTPLTSVISGLVALYNELGVFTHAKPVAA